MDGLRCIRLWLYCFGGLRWVLFSAGCADSCFRRATLVLVFGGLRCIFFQRAALSLVFGGLRFAWLFDGLRCIRWAALYLVGVVLFLARCAGSC